MTPNSTANNHERSSRLSRRGLLRGGAGAAALMATGCHALPLPELPAPQQNGAAPRIDVHCHIFSGLDIPVEGYLKNIRFGGMRLGRLFGPAAVGKWVRAHAPSFEAEREVLLRLIREPGSCHPPMTPFEAVRMMKEISHHSGRRAAEVRAAFSRDVSLFQWAKLGAQSRYAHAATLISLYGYGDNGIQLFVPATVDVDLWVGESAVVSTSQQAQLMELISCVFPGRFHGFIGFNPWKAVLDKSHFESVKRAVLTQGFLGVKIYPSMGFRPIHNRGLRLRDGAPRGSKLDAVLHKLYRWCCAMDVPLMAHASPTLPARKSGELNTAPFWWHEVLKSYPTLRLNLGHFGGMKHMDEDSALCDFESKDGWPAAIMALMRQYPNLFADVSNYRATNKYKLNSWLRDFRKKVVAYPVALQRVMYGSDWFMLALQPDEKDFKRLFFKAYARKFPGFERAFLGGNAARFLGIADDDSQTVARLNSFYRKHGLPQPSWLPPTGTGANARPRGLSRRGQPGCGPAEFPP